MRGPATFAPTLARAGETVSQRSPNADTAGNTGYNAANTTAPQRRTYLSPTSPGNERHLYGQGKPNAMDAADMTEAAEWSTGIVSEDSTGEVQVESRLFYQGTVEGGGTANELSRLTDAREKGRIGILGSALAYAGLAGRVTSESIGRDLNPLGRGDGRAYVAGQLNLGRISPRLPGNIAAVGTGDSINNNEQQGLGGPSGPGGNGSAGTVGCDCNLCCNFEVGLLPCAHVERKDVDPCAAACDLCNSASGADCMDATCDCLTCQWHKYNADPCHFVPPFQEALCENGCCCPGCPCYGSGGDGGGVTGGGGCPGCGGVIGYIRSSLTLSQGSKKEDPELPTCKKIRDSAYWVLKTALNEDNEDCISNCCCTIKQTKGCSVCDKASLSSYKSISKPRWYYSESQFCQYSPLGNANPSAVTDCLPKEVVINVCCTNFMNNRPMTESGLPTCDFIYIMLFEGYACRKGGKEKGEQAALDCHEDIKALAQCICDCPLKFD